MARCEITGKSPVVKNKVSHSNIKTKSRAMPNVQQKRIFSPTLNRLVSLKMSTGAIRSMEHAGGFDVFLLKQKEECLSPRALLIRGQIKRRISGQKKKA